ncbi:MAG: flagellar filament capping protein FliD [Bacillota bacterium]
MSNPLSLGGLISGMNTESMIRQIMELERAKLYSKENQKSQLEARQKAWSDVRSSLSTLRSKLDSLRLPFTFRARTATLTDESVASVTASTGALLTTYSLSVSQLAQAHVVSHTDATTQDTANTALGVTGSFNIGIGTDLAQIDVASTDTLNSLADKINAAKKGVSASVVKVTISGADKYRLVLTSSETGTDNAIVMQDVTAGTLQNLGFKDGTNAYTNVLSAAANAIFTLNSVNYERSSNTVDDVVPGLTITLKKQGADANTQFTIGLDADKVLSAVKSWIEAVNSTQDLLNKVSAYDADKKVGGPLSGDNLIRNLQRVIRSSLSNVVAGLPTDMNRLSQIGITTGAYDTADYGKVIIDEAKFKEMLTQDAEGVAKLFGALQNNPALSTEGATVALSAGSSTAAGYDLADVINDVTDSDRFGTAGGGWKSGAAPTTSAPQGFEITFSGTKLIDNITLYQPDPSDFPASDYGLKDFTLEYWDDATSTWKTIESVTNFGGTSGTWEFDPISTSKVRVQITATYNNYEARVTELKVGEYNNGAAIDQYRYIRSVFETESGALDVKDATLTKQLDQVNDQIDRIEEQLAEREERLRQQFARMEQALARLRNQGNAFLMQMLGTTTM